MIKYENGKIYKIITNDPNESCYVGSTAQPYLSNRMADHISAYKTWVKSINKNKHKIMSFELFDKYGVENCKIILLESVNAKSKDELRMKEQEYISKLKCVNKKRAYCSSEDNKIRDQQYYIDNKDKIKERMSNTYIEKRDTICARVNEYRKANLETINAKKKHYRMNHGKETIKRQQQKTYYCPNCSHEIRWNKKSRHNRTKLHINNTLKYMESIIESYNKVQPIEIQNFILE